MNTLFKKLNILVLMGSTLLLAWNLYYGISKGISPLHPSISTIFIISLISFISIFKENKTLKILEISIFFAVGAMAAMSDPFNFYAIGVWSVALFILYAYGFMETKTRQIIIYYIIFSTLIFILSVFSQPPTENDIIYEIATYSIYYSIHIVSLFIIFSTKRKEYEKLILSKQALADLGERITILVHDTKNHLQKVEGSLYLLKDSTEEESKIYLNIINRTLTEANNKFESLLSLNKRSDTDEYSLSQLVQSVIYLSQLTPEGRRVKYESDCESVILSGYKQELLQAIDNIIKNSIEAGSTLIQVRGKINGLFSVEIQDNGPGINHCKICKNKKCKECTLIKSSKDEGHGIGFKSIQAAVKMIPKGELLVESNNKGTTFIIKGDIKWKKKSIQ
jgi:signal transduction histidine kinase